MKMGIDLDFKKIKIGRGAQCDIVLTNPSISTNHCFLERVKGGYKLHDNNSTNGIKFEDRRFDVIAINSAIQFYLGDVLVQFAFTEEEFKKIDGEGKFDTKQKPKLPPMVK